MLQGCSQLIDVPGGDIDRHAIFEKSGAVAADGVAPDLQEQSVDRVGIKFLRGKTYNLTKSVADRERFTIRPLTGHGVESVSQSDNADRHGNVFHHQPIWISRTVAALVVGTHDFGNARPGKLYAADDLMSDHRVVSHFAEFCGVERCGFPE